MLDSQYILQINASFNATVNRLNSQREHHLADLKIQQSELLQDVRAENSKLEDIYRELRDPNVALARAIQPVDKIYDTHIENNPLTIDIQRQLQREISTLRQNSSIQEDSIKQREALKIQKLKELHLVKNELETPMSLIKILPLAKQIVTGWSQKVANTLVGYLIPVSMFQFMPHDLNKLFEKNPYTSTVNFVKNILEYSNDIGWNSDQKIEIFLLWPASKIECEERKCCFFFQDTDIFMSAENWDQCL